MRAIDRGRGEGEWGTAAVAAAISTVISAIFGKHFPVRGREGRENRRD